MYNILVFREGGLKKQGYSFLLGNNKTHFKITVIKWVHYWPEISVEIFDTNQNVQKQI